MRSYLTESDCSEASTFTQYVENLWKWGALSILLVLTVVTVPALAVMVLFCILAFGLGRRRDLKPRGSHGTSRWASLQDLVLAGCLDGARGMVLGRPISGGFPAAAQQLIVVPDANIAHLGVVGPSGTFKSTSFSAPNLLQPDASGCVVLDPKGELFRITAQYRAEVLGHEIVVIDPYHIAGKHSFGDGRINPVLLRHGADDLVPDDARRMANALVVRTGEEKEPFWSNSAQALIQSILMFLMSAAKEETAHLNQLREILTSDSFTNEVLDYMASSDACYGLLRRMSGQIRQLKGQTAASVFGVANSHLEFLDSVPVARVLSETSFDPQLLLHNKMTIYLCLPVDRISEMQGLQRILVTSLINYVFQAGESRDRRVRLLLDEAASLGAIDALYNAIMFGRGFGLRVSLLFQSISQVAICFPDSKAADFKGTVALAFTGVNDFQGAEEVSKWIGNTTVTSCSAQYSTNWGTSASAGTQDTNRSRNEGGSESYSESETGRPLIQPEEVLQLPRSMGIALLPSIRPILFEKVPYFAAANETVTRSRRNLDVFTWCLILVAVLMAGTLVAAVLFGNLRILP